ncbi:MAG TPA: cytochrome P450 [Pirellulaceae bacterium]|nr:cytochrome P450 [Pirellulaceae bacterium]
MPSPNMPGPKNPFDLTSAEFIRDPYSAYATLRQGTPVCWDERLSYWLVTRYADVFALLRDHRVSSNSLGDWIGRVPAEQQAAVQPLKEILTNRIVLTDSPDHRRIRGLMQLAFTPRRVELMRREIESYLNHLLGKAEAAGRVELVSQVADPLPAHVIASMLGLPQEDHHRFKQWTDEIYLFMGASAVPLAERARRGTAAAVQLREYLTALFAQIRAKPRDDLLSGMVAAEEQGEKLSQTELFSNVVGMINAAHETTTNLIANTVLHLLQNREQWEALVADPGLVESTVEEGLRFESPIQVVARRTLEEIEVAGVKIPANQPLALGLAAANRDDAQFPHADRFDIRRPDNKHVAFGGGQHFCLGAALGRLEGQIALATISRRWPKLQLADESIAWRPYPVFRGLKALHLRP